MDSGRRVRQSLLGGRAVWEGCWWALPHPPSPCFGAASGRGTVRWPVITDFGLWALNFRPSSALMALPHGRGSVRPGGQAPVSLADASPEPVLAGPAGIRIHPIKLSKNGGGSEGLLPHDTPKVGDRERVQGSGHGNSQSGAAR